MRRIIAIITVIAHALYHKSVARRPGACSMAVNKGLKSQLALFNEV